MNGRTKLFFVLQTMITTFVKCDKTCDVGGTEKELGGGLCDDNGPNPAKCQQHCQSQFRGELVGSRCSDLRANQKRECICQLKCATGGCWGDPHCYSFDGLTFGYQGLAKHYLVKPADKYPTLPSFEVTQSNRVWLTGPYSVLDTCELNIPQWANSIEIKAPPAAGGGCTLRVNGNQQPIPFKFSREVGQNLNFINVSYTDSSNNELTITTSFGLRIVINVRTWGSKTFSDLTVSIPRHPELNGKTRGLLGRWNDNQADDFIDANGKTCTPDGLGSWDFGDSWIVSSAGRSTSQSDRDKAKKLHSDNMNKIPPGQKKKFQKLCQDNIQSPEVINCAKQLGRPAPSVDECVNDLAYADEGNNYKELIKSMIDVFSKSCKTNIQCKCAD